MYIIRAEHPDNALSRGVTLLRGSGLHQDSRNGPVLSLASPVIIGNMVPLNRVSLSSVRDANPFFHYLESLWMLAGRHDVAFVKEYVSRMGKYSDDGVKLHGAYGYRWRRWFGYDQIELACTELRANPESRRVVVSMWDAGVNESAVPNDSDLHVAIGGGADVPCNTELMFRVTHGRLSMTVVNRSNDVVFGAHGANVVHMSILLEYMAAKCGYGVGVLYQITNNYHIYTENDVVERILRQGVAERPYLHQPTQLFTPQNVGLFDEELPRFFDEWDAGARSTEEFSATHSALRNLAVPMVSAYHWHKHRNYVLARAEAARIHGYDWHYACLAWLGRREAAFNSGKDLSV